MEIDRQVYHHEDGQIKAHAFLCMPVYYLLWPLTERPGPLFAQQTRHIESGSLQSKDRRWTVQSVKAFWKP